MCVYKSVHNLHKECVYFVQLVVTCADCSLTIRLFCFHSTMEKTETVFTLQRNKLKVRHEHSVLHAECDFVLFVNHCIMVPVFW